MKLFSRWGSLAAVAGACGCAGMQPQPQPCPEPAKAATAPVAASTTTAVAVSTAAPSGPGLRRLELSEWPPIQDELDAKSLARAAEKSLKYLEKFKGEKKFFRVGDVEVGQGLLSETVRAIVDAVRETKDPAALEERLKRDFDLFESVGSDGAGKVVFSSYYQPVLPASLKHSKKYPYPLYKKPSDMVDVDMAAFNPKWKGESILGRVQDGKLVPYFERRDIDVRKILQGKKLEVAWLANQFDRLDLHIQGSGILELPDGRKMLAKYAANNALPYKSVGLAVVGSGAMSRAEITHDKLRDYLTEHPEGEGWLIAQNPRYVFFEIVELPDDGQPFGTIDQPLTPGRSIAIDTKVIPLGAVAYMKLPMPQSTKEGELLGVFPTSRFAMCQDTGGAILGPGRVDIYMGHGPQAKMNAVNQWHEGKLYILLKKLPARER
ncbi:MAG: MltA domain-containing protein [Elusimicrobia bacterium]|nr:MltA domain-containing protein [Elusimicrobiota bacterium]